MAGEVEGGKIACNYEVEYTYEGEVGLHERRRKCEKNPDHNGFFPIKSFTKDQLPEPYRTDGVANFIEAISDLTVRVRVKYTSMSRPVKLPLTDFEYPSADLRGVPLMRVGTGFVIKVDIEDGVSACPCFSCKHAKYPSLKWARLTIATAAHVICTADELVHAEVDFFYDDDDTFDIAVKTFSGKSVRAHESPITSVDLIDDFCEFEIYTHDLDTCRRLSKFSMRDLLTFDTGLSSSTNSSLTMVVSHPHGCPKCVSWGEWTARDHLEGPEGEQKFRYHYNTPTCPGSSGALVWMLETLENKWQKIYVHSAGLPDGLNISGAREMFKEFISNLIQCKVS